MTCPQYKAFPLASAPWGYTIEVLQGNIYRMRTYITTTVAGVSTLLLPVLAFAQTAANPQLGLFGLVSFLNALLNGVIILLITAAVVMIFWYAVKYVLSAGDAKSMKAAMMGMIWAVVTLAIMVSIWGLVKFLQNTLGVNGTTTAQHPSQLTI